MSTPPAVWRLRESLYRLLGRQCRDCGRVHYPPLKACPYCSSRNLSDVELPRRGRLVSYSIVYSTPSHRREKTPLIVGLIDLGVARVVAEITDADASEIREDMEVEAVLRKLREDGASGLIVYALKFRPSLVNRRSSTTS
ncbi:MAG: Zn-ribbon domain-containing OB-fold protein [Acidilobaceae archaeon]